MLYPIGDKVVVKKLDGADTTSGGVIIPDTSQEATIRAEVIAVGPGNLLLSGSRGHMQCKVGDVVVYPKYGAKELEIDGEDYLIIKEKELLTILEQ